MEKNKQWIDSPYFFDMLVALMALILIVTMLSGCSVCADCQCRTYSTQPNVDPISSEFEVCGREDIRDTRGVKTQKITVGNKTYTVTTDCSCQYQ